MSADQTSKGLSKLQQSLSSTDVTSICDAADAAWKKARSTDTEVRFKWRGKLFKSTLTNFRMKVDTLDGDAVACRWY